MERRRSRATRRFAPILLLSLACAGGSARLAQGPIDWREATDRWSLHIVTVDPDGNERVTRIWLALVDAQGALRTGDSRWWRNLERDPDCRIRVAGVDYPVRVEPVTAHEERARIDAAFVAKYGWLERLMFRQEPGETHQNYARVRPRNAR